MDTLILTRKQNVFLVVSDVMIIKKDTSWSSSWCSVVLSLITAGNKRDSDSISIIFWCFYYWPKESDKYN